MAKYYTTIMDRSNLNRKSGSNAAISSEFYALSSLVLSRCNFLQNLMQQIVYISYGKELSDAKKTLKKFPNPKARLDFICSFPYTSDDPALVKVFNFARSLFLEIYDLRNVLAHEIWSSSDDYPNLVLFSSLDEDARLQMATGRLWHIDDATSEETYKSIIRFIKSNKIISNENLECSIRDIDLCNWCFMIIINILSEYDPNRRNEARKPLFVYRGVSHLFDKSEIIVQAVNFTSSKSKNINK